MRNSLEKIIFLVSQRFDINPAKLSENTQFSEIGADSLDVVDIITELESEYSVEVPDEAIDEMRTIGDVARYIDGC